MVNIKTKSVFLVLAVTLFFLTGCSTESEEEPTVDPNMIYTAAAETVQAQLQVAQGGTATAAALAAALPTATMEQPTALPTAAGNPADPNALVINLTPGVTAIVAAGATTLPTVAGVSAIATLVPTAAPTVNTTGDKAEYIDQDPDDGTTYGNDVGFNTTFQIKNTGTTTWDVDNYYLATMVSSDSLAEKNYALLREEVPPGKVTKIITDMHTPGTDGEYKSTWCFLNKNNPTKCLVIVYVTINVN